MSFTPKGIVVPVVTPIDQNGKFNEKAYRSLIDYLADNGISGVFPFGTTGEFYAFDMGFYANVLEVTKDAVAGRMAIYAGANDISTAGAARIAKAVENVGGIDALSVLTPMFISQTQDEVYAFYRDIAAETSLPIIIYNNRPKTNITVEPKTRGAKNFHVMMGRDTLIYAALCYGATGAIASCANVAPRIASDIYDKFIAGDREGALEAQFKFSALRIATSMGTFPVVLKEALKMIGHDCGDCVKPIQPLNDEQRGRLRAVLVEMGLL